MRRGSRLDMLVYRFQHNWETVPRFRAAASGVIALVFALILCSCVGVVSTMTNSVLASVGAGGGGSGTGRGNTGTGKLASSTAFPTYTLPPYASTVVPGVSPIASSQTPPPVPTAVPTATAQPTVAGCGNNCGGGPSVTVTASYSPPIWHAGKSATIHVHTSQPNIGITFLMNLPGAFIPQGQYTPSTDGSGNLDFPFTVPSSVTAGPGQVEVYDSAGGGSPGATLNVVCAP